MQKLRLGVLRSTASTRPSPGEALPSSHVVCRRARRFTQPPEAPAPAERNCKVRGWRSQLSNMTDLPTAPSDSEPEERRATLPSITLTKGSPSEPQTGTRPSHNSRPPGQEGAVGGVGAAMVVEAVASAGAAGATAGAVMGAAAEWLPQRALRAEPLTAPSDRRRLQPARRGLFVRVGCCGEGREYGEQVSKGCRGGRHPTCGVCHNAVVNPNLSDRVGSSASGSALPVCAGAFRSTSEKGKDASDLLTDVDVLREAVVARIHAQCIRSARLRQGSKPKCVLSGAAGLANFMLRIGV